MTKSVSSAWLWFLSLFLIIFSILATGLFFQHRRTSIKLKNYTDSLKIYRELYTNLKSDYITLRNKYDIALRSALAGSKMLSEKQQQLLKMQKVLEKQDSIIKSVQVQVKKAMAGYNSNLVQVNKSNGKLYLTMREKLLFPLGSAQVQPEGIRALGKLAKVLKNNKKLNIIIEGHTDTIPIKPGTKCWKDNWDLSAARAISVARILINRYGVNPARIEIAGKAQYDPVATNETPAGRALNRRIEIIVSPDLSELYKIYQQ